MIGCPVCPSQGKGNETSKDTPGRSETNARVGTARGREGTGQEESGEGGFSQRSDGVT